MNGVCMRSFLFWVLLFLMSSVCLATTYIVKEGDVEVGQYVEEDGKDATEILQISAEKQYAKKAPLYSQDAGYTDTGTHDYVYKHWEVRGYLYDLIKVKPLAEGKITFHGGGEKVVTDVQRSGFFSAKLPQLEAGSYFISVEPPAGYNSQIYLRKRGELETTPLDDRLKLQGVVEFSSGGISGTRLDLVIGLYPKELDPTEAQRYAELMAQEAGA